ncbi:MULTISPECIES: hypothetical protein [unclassified Rhizobium]|uniref:hypothetical protein n=1 Tax=unclassified Rhizobium TaxID=2613769 RepID=UPI0012E1FC91|nr:MULTISPECIES: hypothetical protein [unclassified Rhizobium]
MRREGWLFGRNPVGGFVLVGRVVSGLRIGDVEIGRIAGDPAARKLFFKAIRRRRA